MEFCGLCLCLFALLSTTLQHVLYISSAHLTPPQPPCPAMSKSPITCHVLDSTLGKPAANVRVQLEALSPLNSQFHILATGATNSDGRCPDLLAGQASTDVLVAKGVFKMTFFTGEYFAQAGRPTFYPQVEVSFRHDDGDAMGCASRRADKRCFCLERSCSSSQKRRMHTTTSHCCSRRSPTPPTAAPREISTFSLFLHAMAIDSISARECV